VRFFAFYTALLIATACLSQPVERPPRPGEDQVRQPERPSPVLDRDYKRIDRSLRPSFGGNVSYIVYPAGTYSAVFGGVRYGAWGFGIEAGYIDYRREFNGSKMSYVSPGDSSICEKGSFFRPSAYFEFEVEIERLSIVPRAKLGYAAIICRRWYRSDETDSMFFDRDRFINALGVDLRYDLNPVSLGLTAEWLAINPWFYFYPEDFGLFSIGFSILY